MIFIAYSQVSEEKLNNSLGMPEYSYYFVLRGFLPVLRELGQVVLVSDPEKEVDAIYDDCRKRDEECVFLTFSPPNKSAVGLRCPTLCVFAWEFDHIPDEVWDGNPKNDWRYVFADHGRTITLSRYSADAVRKAMGQDFPVASIPVPVWDDFGTFASQHHVFHDAETEMMFRGNIIDSRNYAITADSFEIKNSFDGFCFNPFPGGTIRMGFSLSDVSHAYLGGFYEPESWGTWSRIEKPWILLPFKLTGEVRIKLRLNGYAGNANREISLSLGRDEKKIRIAGGSAETDLVFHLDQPENVLIFSNLDLTPVPGARDARSMAVGLHYLELSADAGRTDQMQQTDSGDSPRHVSVEGVVYTSVFNPGDDRKNWIDMVKAFCAAFQDVEDATLVLKMTHHSLSSFLGRLHFMYQQMWPFKCRIIALHGYLDEAEYEKLIASTSFYVNAARCEGLCLPLMEFMSCGKPAIAPCHTSLADYVEESSTLIVRSGVEPAIWPHDPRDLFRALRYRIDWESLMNVCRQSYDIFKNKPDVYRGMAEAARLKMKEYSSIDTVKKQLKTFLNLK
jgi:glycosyltransferase involved in cell wall biosynthesis